MEAVMSHSRCHTALSTMFSTALLRTARHASLRSASKNCVVPKARIAFFSSSHDDFAPKRTAIEDDEEAISMIQEHVNSNPIMLYMKGNPSMPMCGFSARVVGILQDEGADFSSVNVLDYPAIREGVKKFSEWPTIPQLYVGGEFIGGCDIVTSMHESGELKQLLSEAAEKEEQK